MPRLIVVSNRVAIQSRNTPSQAGGLAVVVRSVLKRHGGLWFGWSGTVSTDEDVATKTVKQGGLTYSSPICGKPTIRNTTTASPTGCCGRYCTIGSTLPSSPAGI